MTQVFLSKVKKKVYFAKQWPEVSQRGRAEDGFLINIDIYTSLPANVSVATSVTLWLAGHKNTSFFHSMLSGDSAILVKHVRFISDA